MNLPNFLCLGAQKSGTTTISDILKDHPNIYLPGCKEVHYFEHEENYKKGINWYSEFFNYDTSENIKIIGEITPDYMAYNYVLNRIVEALGTNIKILIVLRNPVDRAYSQFNHHVRLHVEKERNFISAISKESINSNISYRESWHTPAYYLSKGLYYNQVKRCFEVFSRQNIHIALFEDLFIEKDKNEFKALYEFLGIPYIGNIPNRHSHKSIFPKSEALFDFVFVKNNKIKSTLKQLMPTDIYAGIRKKLVSILTEKPKKLDQSIKNKLIQEVYLDDIKKLEELADLDLSVWYKNSFNNSL